MTFAYLGIAYFFAVCVGLTTGWWIYKGDMEEKTNKFEAYKAASELQSYEQRSDYCNQAIQEMHSWRSLTSVPSPEDLQSMAREMNIDKKRCLTYFLIVKTAGRATANRYLTDLQVLDVL